MIEEITLAELRGIASRGDLKLDEDEAQRLVTSVNRARKQAAELRQLVNVRDEPAGVFHAAIPGQK